LFVYLNSPADHLAHRRGPQVGKRRSRSLAKSRVHKTHFLKKIEETF